ncbi:MAG: hypothetical protein ACOCQR_03670 [bacterium]
MIKTNLINQKTRKLWNEYADNNDLIPGAYSNVKKNSLLFIGINPSDSVKNFNKIISGTQYQYLNFPQDYLWGNHHNLKLKTVLAIEELARTKADYFRKLQDISDDVNKDWEHVDLFFIREKSQKKLKDKILSQKNNEYSLSDFAKQQLNINYSLIKKIEPICILVNNAYASKLIRYFYSNDLSEFDEEIGTYKLAINEHTKVPIIFSCVLDGARHIDIGSYERLKWQVRYIFKKLTI